MDDDPDFISFVRVCLWRLCPRLEVVAFSSALEALQFLPAHHVDLLLTDFNMPFMDGLELIHHVRAGHHEPDVPIVVMSRNEIEAQALANGASLFVGKYDLLTRLESILQRFGLIASPRGGDEGAKRLPGGTKPSSPAVPPARFV